MEPDGIEYARAMAVITILKPMKLGYRYNRYFVMHLMLPIEKDWPTLPTPMGWMSSAHIAKNNVIDILLRNCGLKWYEVVKFDAALVGRIDWEGYPDAAT